MMRWFGLALIIGIALLTRASAESHTYLYGWGSPLQTPGHPVVYDFDTNADRKVPVAVDLYRVPTERAITALRTGKEIAVAESAAFVHAAHAIAASSDNAGFANQRHLAVSLPSTGYYFMVARAGDGVYGTLIDVTAFGLVTINAGNDRLIAPVDLTTFDRAGNVKLALVDDSGTRALAENAGGLYHLPSIGDRAHGAVLGTGPDGSITIVALQSGYEVYGAGASRDIGYIQTDRPIYRPGQSIDIRAILRTGSIGAYGVPTGTRKFRVNAPDGTVVFERTLTFTPFGTLHAVVPLPQDAQLGSYSISVGDTSRGVIVAAYKKPEYELTLSPKQKYVVGSDRASFSLEARYFFGRPAAGMHLHYAAYLVSHPIFWWGPYEFAFSRTFRYQRVKIAEGDFITDGQGHHAVAVGTEKTDSLKDLTLQVDGRDASGRTVQTEQTLPVTPASFAISFEPKEWFAQAGHGTQIDIHAKGYDDKARAGARIHVKIRGQRYDEKQRKPVELGTVELDVTTDARGDASFRWTPKEGGSYTFEASSPDERGLIAKGQLYLWALGANEESWFAPIERPVIIAEKTTFAPGERPRVLITLPKPNRDAIVVTAADRLVDARVIRVAGTSTSFEVPVPNAVSHLALTVLLPNENGIDSANVQLAIAPPPKALHVAISSRKARYVPGERATFDLRATDARGRPVRSEIGLGVVDEAIYAVQAEDPTDPFDVFYNRVTYAYANAPWFQPNRGLKSISHVMARSAGALSNVSAALPTAAEQGVPIATQVRKNFLDNAFWSPTVVTDASGRATVSFTWPDNLTTWRATGVGVTAATDIGRDTGSALVTKDFLVRLETPRFLRAGDRSSIVGIAHGLKSHPDVLLQLDAGALASERLATRLHLGGNDDASTSWPVSAPGVGNVLLTLRGSDGARTDGTQSWLPLLGATAMEHERNAGSLPKDSTLALQLPGGDVAGDLHLTIAPSIVAQLVQSVRLFDVYPYYCTEQTTSAALPAAALQQLGKRYGVSLPDDVQPRTIVGHAIDRLSELQHGDGGWGWWENDQSEPFMTAYAVYGLAEMKRDLGSLPNPYMLDRGAQALQLQLQSVSGERLRAYGGGRPGDEWNVRAFMLMALADANPELADRALVNRAYDHLRELDPYGLAVLGLAAHALHDDAHARVTLAELDRRATQDGPYVFWHREAWDWEWTSDPIETTAYALRLYVALDPQSPRVAEIVDFLRAQRRGDWWYTTKDSAAAAVAVADAVQPQRDELHPDETIRIRIGDRIVRELHVTTALLDAADAQVVVPATQLHAGGTVTFEQTGRGALYWSSDWERYLPPSARSSTNASEAILERLFARPPELSVSRTYHAPHPGPWRVGDEIEVELTVSSRTDTRYVAIEDPFPAGAEHQPLQGHADSDAWSGFQFLDDRATFFASDLRADYPVRLRYTLRVTTAGSYAAPPPDAFAMYGPPVSAVGSPEAVRVEP